ncbi:MAG: VWA domain-containing protein [Methanosarcina mazei]|uniref:vWA domain-containing protein n=1 Tax=Methanosarcina soligelidi TaxID=1036677 RepID=UPI00064FEAE4|nr:VWA domain-containing protein [Methanosarcina soligelidi]
MPFQNPLALAALLSVIPLIIIYMLRPKPAVLSIPSLMFVLKLDRERKRVYASLTKVVRDPLFLIQLLMLILLSIGAAGYYYTSEEPLSGEHTVLVLDTSASMQVDSRFEDAVRIADGYVSKKNSIILASNIPQLALEGGSASAAEDIFNKVKPGAGTADLSAAVTTGMRLLSEEGGRIIVISDFTNWVGDDPVASKNLAESYGLKVNFIKVGKPAENIGIINGWIEAVDGEYGYTGVVKNYRSESKTVEIMTGRGTSGNASKSFTLDVPAGGTNQFKLANLGPGTTTISLNVDDSLDVDNKAYISIPDTSGQHILYVTDNGKLPSKTALSLVPNIDLEIRKSLPSALDSYTLVVLAQKQNPIANSSVDKIETYVRNGGNAVFIASEALSPEKTEVGLVKLLPVKPLGVEEAENGLKVKETLKSSITEDMKSEEISVRRYMNATERTGSTTLVATESGIPLLSYWQTGKGTVFYMGLNDELGDGAWNNFHNLPEYPVFWIKLVEWLGGIGDISEYNLEAGTVTSLSKTEEIRTPSKTLTANSLLYDEVGIYEVSGKRIAVNMYDDRESNTTVDSSELISRSLENDEPKTMKSETYTARNEITNYLIGILFLLMLLEILIVRGRGEL